MEAIQNLIFDNKESIPNGVYLQLQNALKDAHNQTIGKDLYKCTYSYPTVQPRVNTDEYSSNEVSVTVSSEVITILPDEKKFFDEHGLVYLDADRTRVSPEADKQIIKPSVLQNYIYACGDDDLVGLRTQNVMVFKIEPIN